MSSSKIKKRTLPTVPAKDVKSSPATTSAIVNSAIKQAAARALFQGKKKDFISTSRPISPSAPQNSPKHLNRRSNQIKSATTVSTPSPKSLKTNKAPVKNNAKSISSTKKRKENLNSASSINQSNHQESEQELQEKKINLKQKGSLLLRADLPTKGSNDDKSSIIVAVRVRPFNMREVSQGATRIVSMEGNMTMLSNPSTSSFHNFAYDYSFWSFDSTDPVAPFMSQENIYESVAKPLLNYSFEGYNTCLFAYGQTGSGKSYTIMGYCHEEEGIVPRFSRSLFEKIFFNEQEDKDIHYSVEISFYEIYNEKIFDLLEVSDSGDKQRLCVREHPETGPYVQGLSVQVVGTHKDIQDWLELGNKKRATAATGMNDKSSRSHSVFTIVLTQVKSELFDGTSTQLQKISKINLIDLAGSERASQVYDEKIMKDTYTVNARLKEGGCINKSLHTLGKVISILSEIQSNPKKKHVYIPYRDSVLTWLLKESLGGNAKTTMLATISPAAQHYSETLSTLRYAQEARKIVNKARVNEDQKSKLIREMLYEIERLKCSQMKTGDKGHALEKEVTDLREKLKETQGALAHTIRSWQEKLEHSERKQKEATKHLRRSGISFTKLESRSPCLVNLNEDPQLAEVLLYILKEGNTQIGSRVPENNHDIQLKGNLVAEDHCWLQYDSNTLLLHPAENAPTYINGELVTTKTLLHHGDRIVIGGNHFFRLNYPKEAKKLPGERSLTKCTFEYAKEELVQSQNARLKTELEEERLKAEQEAMEQIKQAQTEAELQLENQKNVFQRKLDSLEKKLEDTIVQKQAVEGNHQYAKELIKELKDRQKLLEDEIISNRKKLQMEAVAAKQALREVEDNKFQIIKELEREKQKMLQELEEMKKMKKTRDKMRSSITISVNKSNSINDSSEMGHNATDAKDLLSISLMIQEANKISERHKLNFVFKREDIFHHGQMQHYVRVTRADQQKSALIEVDEFNEELGKMKELLQGGQNTNIKLFDYLKWTNQLKSARLSLSNSSFMASLNKSLDMSESRNQNSVYESTALSSDNGISHNSASDTDMDILKISAIRSEASQMSNTANNAGDKSFEGMDLSQLKLSLMESFLEDDVQEHASIIAKLLQILFQMYSLWHIVISQKCLFSNTSVIEDKEQPIFRLASNMKSLKEIANTISKVHKAVGLEQLKDMSQLFQQDVQDVCAIFKVLPNTTEDEVTEKFDRTLLHMIEICAALSLASVDHLHIESDTDIYIEKGDTDELRSHFINHQSRFLQTMIDEVLCTLDNGIEEVKQLQISCTHEMSDDLVDGVMNVLTSIITLLHNCKHLVTIYSDVNATQDLPYYTSECHILRQILTAVVDYNENIYNLVQHAKQIAKNCDNLETFIDLPIESADTTKCICKAGKDLLKFAMTNKEIDNDLKVLLQDCYEKFEFSGKAVRVGVTILVKEVENDLDVSEEQSLVSFIQTDISFDRRKVTCPLNKSTLEISSMSDNLRNAFSKVRRSAGISDLSISRYIDTSEFS